MIVFCVLPNGSLQRANDLAVYETQNMFAFVYDKDKTLSYFLLPIHMYLFHALISNF